MASPEAPAIDQGAARAAVAEAAARFSTLLRSARQPGVVTLGKWDLTDVAVHVSHSLDAVTAVAQGGGAMVDDLWRLGALSEMLVTGESTRGLGEIADRIDASAARFLAVMAASPPSDLRTWIIEGIEFPMATLTCHVLNELVVHGYDVARAQGAAWVIERDHAALVLCGFLFPVLGVLGRSVVDQQAATGRQIAFDIKVRGAGRAYFLFDDGDLSVTSSPPPRVDCHLSVDPVAFLLVAWGRIDQWPAIGRGKLVAWGRKPWLGLQLRSLLRNP